MDNPHRRPVYSVLQACSELDESIHEFVVGLAEQVDLLQDDEQNSDFEGLEERAAILSGQAERMGYPELARLTQKVSAFCVGQMKDAVQKGLMEITEMARRIRMGHRGSA